jgi:D-3-phosphoglycerate dehydrogenase
LVTVAEAAKPLAVFTDPEELDIEPGRRILEEAGFDVLLLGSRDQERIAKEASEAIALIIGYTRIDAQLLDSLRRLRIVATVSVGVDTIDLKATEERGITVTNVPDAATEEVAAHALALALCLIRRIPAFHRDVRGGMWSVETTAGVHRPSTMTIGVVGLGRIGRRLAHIAAPIFGRLVGTDAYLPAESWPAGVERCTLEEVLGLSDVVSLHVPAQAGDEPLLDERRLSLLRTGAVVVNVSRGSLVDEKALLAALDSGHLSGAGLDVLRDEPPRVDDPLLAHPLAVITPHVAYLSEESAFEYAVRAAENVADWAAGKTPRNIVVAGDQRTVGESGVNTWAS